MYVAEILPDMDLSGAYLRLTEYALLLYSIPQVAGLLFWWT